MALDSEDVELVAINDPSITDQVVTILTFGASVPEKQILHVNWFCDLCRVVCLRIPNVTLK